MENVWAQQLLSNQNWMLWSWCSWRYNFIPNVFKIDLFPGLIIILYTWQQYSKAMPDRNCWIVRLIFCQTGCLYFCRVIVAVDADADAVAGCCCCCCGFCFCCCCWCCGYLSNTYNILQYSSHVVKVNRSILAPSLEWRPTFYWYNVHPHGSTHYQFTCSSMSGIR